VRLPAKRKRCRWVSNAAFFAGPPCLPQRISRIAAFFVVSEAFRRLAGIFSEFFRKPRDRRLSILNGISRLPLVLALFSSN